MLNMDFGLRLVIESAEMEWLPSPSVGVWRKPLEREAKESGHTTSIVRYDPDSRFNTHLHPMGEEIYVIDGTFSDEDGDYPSGTYIRNPPNSSHAPFSRSGCTLFVKLNQFDMRDRKKVRVDTTHHRWVDGNGRLKVMPLHRFENEHVALVRWPSGEYFQTHQHFGGEEILILSGALKDEYGYYPAHTWIRNPHMSAHRPFAEEDTLLLVKTGHLPVL